MSPLIIAGEGPPPPPVDIPSPAAAQRLRPHFRTPFGRNPRTGKVYTVEGGSADHIRSCETAIAMCPLGARNERPEFGWPWPYLRSAPIDPQPLLDALNRFEPRVTNRTAEEYGDLLDDATRIIDVYSEVSAGE